MRTSTEIGSAAKIIGEEKAIELYAKAGFDGWDFSLFAPFLCKHHYFTNSWIDGLYGSDYLKIAKKLKKVSDDNGMVCNQTHAPFPFYGKDIRTYIMRAIECSAEVGAEFCVVHPHSQLGPEENAMLYATLLPFAKEHGVKLAAENLYDWDHAHDHAVFASCATAEGFWDVLNAVDDDDLVACLDIGHAEMEYISGSNSAEAMVRSLGKKIQCLHIHDNDKWHDSHQLPFTMDIDFVPIVKALRDIGYDGWFTMEAASFYKDLDETNIYSGMEQMYAAARKLADIFEEA